MLKGAPLLGLLIVALPAEAFAQRSASLPPLPPLSAQNPLAKVKGLPVRGPRGSRGIRSLIDYMDREMADGSDEIDTPVTGYGNEALWEEPRIVASIPAEPPRVAIRSKRPTGSTAAPYTR